MGAHQHVDLALLEVLEHLAGLGRALEARGHLDPERVVAQALGEGAEVLLGQDRGGHQEHDLLGVGGGLERGAQRHLGLAVAHVAADQAVHRAALLHVGAHGLDGVHLVGGLAVGERALELHLPLGVGGERVSRAALALGVQVDQLAGQRLGRAAGAQLLLLPLLAAQLGQLGLAGLGAHVAADLVDLVAGHEHAVAVAELQLQVVARDVADGLGLEPGEAGDAVVLVHHGDPGAQVGERGHRPRPGPRPAALLGPAAAQQPVLGDDGQLQRGRQEPLAQRRGGEVQARVVRRLVSVQERGLDPVQVVGGALGLAVAGPRDDGPVPRPDQLLQLGLGRLERARGGVGGLGAEGVRLVAGDGGQRHGRPLGQGPLQLLGVHVQVVGVGVVEGGGHVVPVVAQAGRQLLLRRDHHQAALGDQGQHLAEAVHGQHLGHVGALALLGAGGDLGQLTVLGRQLGGGLDGHRVHLLQRPLGERGEEGQALDLDVEQLAAHRALLGGRVHVQDVAAQRELAALLDLVDAVVAAAHEPLGGLVQVQQLALLDRKAVWAQLGVGHLLGQRHGAGHHHRGPAPGIRLGAQRVQRGDAQAGQVRRRGQVGLVGHAAGGIQVHGPGVQELLEVGGEVARLAVVTGHDQRRALKVQVGERGQQVGPQAGGHEHALGRLRRGLVQGVDGGVLVGVCEQLAERHGHAERPPGGAARPSSVS